MFYTTTCAGCGRHGSSPCQGCFDSLTTLGAVAVPGLDTCVALLDYDEISRRLISQLKYGCVRSGVGWLTAALASQAAGLQPRFDVVTWLPASKAQQAAARFRPM